MVLELSNYYLDVAKDRLYVRGAASADRRRGYGLPAVTYTTLTRFHHDA